MSKRFLIVASIFMLALSACAPNGLSAEQAQATANAAVLTAMAGQGNAPATETMAPPTQPADAAPLATPTERPAATNAPASTCGRSGDEINYGDFGAPCATFSATEFVRLMTGGAPKDGISSPLAVYAQIRSLDRAFEADTRIGYQYRNGNSFTIPAAAAKTRVLWLSTSWGSPSWMERLSCDGENPCIVLVDSSADVTVNWSGRGLVLDRPLTAQEIASILAFSGQ